MPTLHFDDLAKDLGSSQLKSNTPCFMQDVVGNLESS